MFVFQLAQMQKKPEEAMQKEVIILQGEQAQQIAKQLQASYSAIYAAMHKG
jgi:hypothetical protein